MQQAVQQGTRVRLVQQAVQPFTRVRLVQQAVQPFKRVRQVQQAVQQGTRVNTVNRITYWYDEHKKWRVHGWPNRGEAVVLIVTEMIYVFPDTCGLTVR